LYYYKLFLEALTPSSKFFWGKKEIIEVNQYVLDLLLWPVNEVLFTCSFCSN